MRRKKGDGITEEQRAMYQADLIDVVNDFLDNGYRSVEIEFVQHRGDLGHEDTNEISTFYAHVIVRGSNSRELDTQAWTADRLQKVQARAATHNANVSVRGDGALEIWLPAIKGDD